MMNKTRLVGKADFTPPEYLRKGTPPKAPEEYLRAGGVGNTCISIPPEPTPPTEARRCGNPHEYYTAKPPGDASPYGRGEALDPPLP